MARWPDSVAASIAGEPGFLGTSALLFVASSALTIWWRGSMAGGLTDSAHESMSMPGMSTPERSSFVAAASYLAMWTSMMVAMMMPSLVPMLSRYRRAVRALGEDRLARLTTVAGIGYFGIWTLLGAAAYALGSVTAAGPRWATVASDPMMISLALLLAGGLQLTAWKLRQLARCRDAPACGSRLAPGAAAALGHGLRLGMHCMLCCAGFILVLLVLGAMDLRVMTLVAVSITVERVAPNPRRAAGAAGVIIIAAGVVTIVRAIT